MAEAPITIIIMRFISAFLAGAATGLAIAVLINMHTRRNLHKANQRKEWFAIKREQKEQTERIEEYLRQLGGISKEDWEIVKKLVNRHFWDKEDEIKHEFWLDPIPRKDVAEQVNWEAYLRRH